MRFSSEGQSILGMEYVLVRAATFEGGVSDESCDAHAPAQLLL